MYGKTFIALPNHMQIKHMGREINNETMRKSIKFWLLSKFSIDLTRYEPTFNMEGKKKR